MNPEMPRDRHGDRFSSLLSRRKLLAAVCSRDAASQIGFAAIRFGFRLAAGSFFFTARGLGLAAGGKCFTALSTRDTAGAIRAAGFSLSE